MKTWLRMTIITMMVGGGFSGLVTTSQFLHHAENQLPLRVILVGTFCGLNLIAIFSGLLFVHDQKRTRPLVAVLAMSIPDVVSPLIVYNFATGASIVLSTGTGAGNSGLNFHAGWGLGSSFQLSLQNAHRWGIGVNVFALGILLLLLRSTPSPSSRVRQSSPAEEPSLVTVP